MAITSEVPTFQVGDVVPLGNTTTVPGSQPFTNAAGAPANPATVTVVLQPPTLPDGTRPAVVSFFWPSGVPAMTPEPGQTGRFGADYKIPVSADSPGMWYGEIRSTGTPEQRDPFRFYVQESAML